MTAISILLLAFVAYIVIFVLRPWRHGFDKMISALAGGIIAIIGVTLVIHIGSRWFGLERSFTDPINIIIFIVGVIGALLYGLRAQKKDSPGKARNRKSS